MMSLSLMLGTHRILIITLDACKENHKVALRPTDKEKNRFFAPDNHKYSFSVMNFGPTNAPTFYSSITSNFIDEWKKIFMIQVKTLSYIDGEPVRVIDLFEIFVGKQEITSGTKTIIYDILIY